MKDLAELSPYMGIYYLSLFMGLLVNGMPPTGLPHLLAHSRPHRSVGVVLHLHHPHASVETE